MFNSILLSVFFVSKSESRSAECSLESFCAINEKHGIIKIMILREFLQESVCQHGCFRWIQPHMGSFIRLRINCSVQPIAVFVTLNHRLIKRDVTRTLVICWL